MSNQTFKFKQFTINQDRCAMKIGTDGVLLGAWTTVNNNTFSVLDIGSGTGILGLMLAQRSDADLIDAIEIDDKAYEQCVNNFEDSPWGDRLFCYHASVQEFTQEIDEKYDVIISNPPFYSEDYKSNNTQRDLARFTDALPFEDLMVCASNLLSENGIFSVIIPFKEESSFIGLAYKMKLFPNRILRVKGNPTSELKRSLIEFSFTESKIEVDELIIETKRHEYTKDYINLTKDFYINM